MTPWEQKGRLSCEKEKASRKKRNEKRKIHGDLRKSPNDRELATDTWLCYYITINNAALLCQGERWWGAGKKGKTKWVKISPTQTKKPKQACFLLAHAASAGLSIQLPWVFLYGTIAWLSLLYCLSGSRRGQAEEVVSRRRRDNLMDVCWYLDH